MLCCGAGQRQFSAREMARGKVGSLVDLLQAPRSPVRETEDGDNTALKFFVGITPPVPASLGCRNAKLCGARRGVLDGVRVDCVFATLTKWFSLTRLETRTKESNIYASIWVANPDAQ